MEDRIKARLNVALKTIVGFAVFLLFAATSMVLFFDINTYRVQVEAAASTALGMEVSINGRLGLGFSPGPYITLSNVYIRNRNIVVANASEASLGVDLIPLLFQEFQINRVWLEEPVISIVRDQNGEFNFDNPGMEERQLNARQIPRISFSAGTLRYFDVQSELLIEATDCRLKARGMKLTGGRSADVLKHLSFAADLTCDAFRKNAFAGSGLKVHASVNNGEFRLDPVTMDLFGGAGSGTMLANFSGDVPRYQVEYALPGLQTEAFFQVISDEPLLVGPMDFTMRLSMEGLTYHQVIGSATGQFSLRASQLTLTGSDLDNQLSRFESSQQFNLIDAGAFFFIGPLGLLASKGYDFASLLKRSDGTSEIQVLVSDWTVDQGEAKAQDVAMATHQHRMALQGSLDFADEQYQDVTLALIDPAGCAQVEQKISGSFQQPVVVGPGIVKSVTGSIRTLAKKGIDLFTDLDCEVFYTGRVSPPV